MTRRYSLTPLVCISVALFVGVVIVTAIAPHLWPWTLSLLLLNHFILAGATLWPRSSLLGSNMVRLSDAAAASGKVAITIDDGPDPDVTPRVLEVLRRHKATASFFCIGERVAAYPDLCRAIIAAGHSIENHSQRHLHRFSLLGPRAIMREVRTAQDSIETVCGQRPHFFRAPAGLRNPFLDPILHKLNLQQASWTRRGYDTRVSDPQVIYQRLTRGLAAGDILLLHDGHAARTANGVPVILEVLPQLLETIAAHGLHTTLLHTADAAPRA